MFRAVEAAAPSLRIQVTAAGARNAAELRGYTTDRAKYFLRVERSLSPK
jgi:hypothetical protein